MRFLFLLVLFVTTVTVSFGQESNCGDGIDNDGDGFIDCFDGDCFANSICKDFYVGKDKLCQVVPTNPKQFQMKLGAASPNRATYTLGRMVVGDLDGDGIPEMVTLHPGDKKLYILNGQDLSVKYTGTISGAAEYYDHAIADVDGDGCAEIFIAEYKSSKWYMSSYSCTATKNWTVQIYGQPFNLGLADFDQDGLAELYYKNEILDAKSGTILVKGTGDWTKIDAGPVAVDLLDPAACTNCAGLELALGGTIYGVNLSPRVANGGSLTLAKSIPAAANYFPKKSTFGYVTSSTSVADFNQDGFLDILTNGASGSTTGATTIFFWDIKNNTYKTYKPSNNWLHGTGRLNIADIDGDGKLNTTFVSGKTLYALRDDLTLLWSKAISEGTSGFTGTTVFDFNNDNAFEIVYRDETNLYIINGDGTINTQKVCKSRTANDYPIVVDVDGDGSTEICVTCATNDSDDINNWSNVENGQIRAYKSNLEAWVPARKVWNQHGYFNVNINDDLTIPKVQQKHHLVYSTGECTTGPNRPLNTFLNQSAILDSKGCPTYATADVIFVPNTISISPPSCPDLNFSMSFTIQNTGDIGLSGTLPITFYAGDPTLAGAVKLGTEVIALNNFNVGDIISVTDLAVPGNGGTFQLYAVLNDNGSTVNTPITLPNTLFAECNYFNNIVSTTVTPGPFQLSSNVISDNFTCASGTTAPNGAAEVFRLVNGNKTTVGYTFYWFDGPTAGAIGAANFTGPVRSGMADGVYTVFSVNNAAQCNSDTIQVTIAPQIKNISLAITVDKPFTNCKNPDGKLTVVVNGGDPFGNFTYEWFEGTVFGTSPTLSKSHVLTNVAATTYGVLVTDKATNCQNVLTMTVPDLTTPPVVTATATDANCNPTNSGSATATVSGSGAHTFDWYNGVSVKPSPDFSGSTYSNLLPGSYTVVAKKTSSGCSSAPFTVIVNAKTSPPVTANATAQQTSCTTPNGAASANVSGSTTTHTFKWFVGNNTLVGNQIGTTAVITGLAAGTYTVQATQNGTGCNVTNTVTISSNIVIPTVAASVTAQLTNCSSPNGTVTALASGSAGPFTYYWFDGNIGVPDTTASNFKGATYLNRPAGFYTVVAVDKTTKCATQKATVEVLDQTVLPTITITPTPQTHCDPATPNGQLVADAGSAPPLGFAYNWFTGSTVTGIPFATTATITGLAAGTYTVLVENLNTGCKTTKQGTVINSLVLPAVTAALDQNLTNCSTPNGQVSANVAGGTAGFTFYWFNGNVSSPVIASADFTGAVYAGVPAGTYTVVAVNDLTSCQSARQTVTVLDQTVLPTITITPTPQTHCDPATPNGQLVADAGSAPPLGFAYNWFTGSTVTGIPFATTATITGLAAGTYTVLVENLNTGCKTTQQGTVINNLVLPTVTAALDQNLTNCSTPNGQVSANVAGGTAGFSFFWFNGNVSSPVIASADFTGAVYAGVPAGTYTVVTVNDLISCQSARQTVTVLDQTVLPTITITPTPQTHCDPATPNGQLVADAGSAPPLGFAYKWFTGSTATGIPFATTATITGLASGTYTVLVENLNTGCKTTQQGTVINNLVSPIIDPLVISHRTNCNLPANGEITATSPTPATFYWFNGNVNNPDITAANFVGPTYTNLAVGSYTVVAISNATACQSARSVGVVNDISITPAVAASVTNNTACDPTKSNGTISVTLPLAEHTYHIYAGQNTNPVNEVIGSPAVSVSNLRTGVYTVQAVNDLTGCKGKTEVTISNSIVQPTITSVTPTTVTSCSTPNGTITAAIDIGVLADYTFSWYDGNKIKSSADYTETSNVLSGIVAGTYTVNAVNTKLGCNILAPVTIDVIDDPSIVISITELLGPGNKIIPSICTSPTGQLAVDASSGVNAGVGFTFSWFSGDKNLGMAPSTGTSTDLLTESRHGSILSGVYTVIVQDNLSGCQDSLALNLPYQDQAALLSILTTPQLDCLVPDGGFEAEITPSAGTILANPGVAQDWYDVEWYQNGVLIGSVQGVEPPKTIVGGLVTGNYTVIAREKISFGLDGCISEPNDINIADGRIFPAITANSLLDNKNCVGVTPNGAIELSIDGTPTPAAGYDYAWFTGNVNTNPTLNPANITAPGHTTVDMTAGSYLVEVTDQSNNCTSDALFQINDAPYVISVLSGDLNLTDQADCSPLDGNAVIADVQIDGSSAGTGFTFTWFESDGITTIPSSSSLAAVGTPLVANDYNVQILDPTSNCTSPLIAFTIEDKTIAPLLVETIVDNTNCIGATPTGSISIQMNGGEPVGDFTIQWFTGSSIGTPLPAANIASPDVAINLAAGDYTVQVTDNNPAGAGCSTIATFKVIDQLPIIGIDPIAAITTIDQADCSPIDGAATVTNITVDGTPIGNTVGYSFEWFDDTMNPIALSGNAATIATLLGAGDYFVQATNNTSNCVSPLTPFTIDNVTVNPTVDAITITENTNCIGATPNGTITLQMNGGEPVGDFTIQWFTGSTIGTPLPAANIASPDMAINLAAGDYTVQVTDNNPTGAGCSTIATFKVIDQLPIINIDPIAAITTIDQADCSPIDGAATVTNITVDGTPIGNTVGYSFEWFDDTMNPIALSGNAATIATLLGAGDYFVQATNNTSNCVSPLTPFTIDNVTVNPTVDAITITENTNCIGATPNGTITLQMNGGEPVGDFTIQWFTESTIGTPLPAANIASPDVAINLAAGDYTVQVTDNNPTGAGCSTIATFKVIDQLPIIGIDPIAAITTIDQADCSPVDGSAIVTDITVDGTPIGNTVGYSFEWFDDTMNPIALSGNAATIATLIGAGDYFVQATNNTSNCVSPLTPFTIDNVTVNPTVDAITITENTNCIGATPNGTITLQMNGGEPVGDFTIQWFTGSSIGTPLPAANIASPDVAINLAAGDYTVQVTDNNPTGAGCSTIATFKVIDQLPIISIDPIAAITTFDQADCSPVDGAATVTNITVDGTPIGGTAGYTFQWFESDGTTPVAGAANLATIGTLIGAGDYFVQATNTTSNCVSSLTPFTIEDVTVIPSIVIVEDAPNIACNTSYTGQLSASVSEGLIAGITAGYTFNWYTGQNNTNPVDFIGTGITQTGLQEGFYTVEVTDTSAPGNSCVGIQSFNMTREIPTFSGTTSTIAQTTCSPTQNGSITVNTITQVLAGVSTTFDMNVPADLSNFSFQWFDENQVAITGVVVSNTSPGLDAGTYFVQVTNALGCTSTFIEAIIDDQTLPPAISLDQFLNPAVCILPETPGSLQVSADGSLNFGNYTFAWFEGPDTSGPQVVVNNPSITNIAYSDPLEYTVRVTNNASNCFSLETFQFKPDTVEIQTIASAVPLTSCDTDNGSLFATVQNGNGNFYDYEWYSGATVSGAPIFTTNDVLVAPIGTYTAIARHPTLGFCVSTPSTTDVTDGKVYPTVNVFEKAPLTYCDPANPNGVAVANVGGSVVGYNFEWYENSFPGNLVYTGSEAGNLKAITYVVRAIDQISGCDNTTPITISNNPVQVMSPTLTVLSERTDCALPNGLIEVSVNGITKDYIFNWYDGSAASGSPDGNGEYYRDLDNGFYTATATDRVSGCVSAPVTKEVMLNTEDPQFNIEITSTICDQQSGLVVFVPINNVEVQTIEWDINGTILNGPILSNLPAGFYTVTAISSLQCQATLDFELKSDLNIYNGVSRNNDGMNDFFEIGCINEFPGNNVRIFNRAGALVYEANGYDNGDVIFNGSSNRGVNILGNELPDGTYFYIITKNDGSEPRTGYLELMH